MPTCILLVKITGITSAQLTVMSPPLPAFAVLWKVISALNGVSFFCLRFQLSSTLNRIVFYIIFYRQPCCHCCSFKGLIKFLMLQMRIFEVFSLELKVCGPCWNMLTHKDCPLDHSGYLLCGMLLSSALPGRNSI